MSLFERVAQCAGEAIVGSPHKNLPRWRKVVSWVLRAVLLVLLIALVWWWYAPKDAMGRPSLTPRSTRTPPALPFALSQLLASSASFSASVQAGPVSFIR
jgi:hypothetical protein